MFTIRCTTCDAKLAVKSDELVGQILACPKCGGMVLVKRPEDELTPIDLALEEEHPVLTRFPDPATYETDSGIMNPDEVAAIMAAATTAAPPTPPPVLTEKEIRTRKIMLGLLVGLVLLLVLAVGIMVSFKGNRSKQNESEQIAANPSAEEIEKDVFIKDAPDELSGRKSKRTQWPPEEPEKAAPPGVEPESVEAPHPEPKEDAEKEEKRELLANLLSRTPKPPVENLPDETSENGAENNAKAEKPTPEIRSSTDLLASLERKMPGLLSPEELVAVDIPARLALPLAELKLSGTPLLSVVRAFSRLTEIPITLDIDEFRCRGIRVDTPLTKQFEAGTIGGIFSQLLAGFELEPVVEDRQILVAVSPEHRNRLQEKTFDISDLVEQAAAPGEQLTPERLAEIVRLLVDPVGFAPANPGDTMPMLRVDGRSLVVRHRWRVLDESLRVLEQLRVIRSLPQTTKVEGELLAPEAFGWDNVMKPMTLNYYQPTPLTGILDQLEEKTKLRILVDHRSLHRALCPLRSMKATVRCNRGTVNEALESLLASIDMAVLTYRIVDHDVLEITTAYAARQPEKMSVEVHRYETPEKPLPNGETPENLVRTLRAALEPESWRNANDPETVGLGDIVIDRPSGCLIVRQSQPIQRQLRLWLGKRLDGNAADSP